MLPLGSAFAFTGTARVLPQNVIFSGSYYLEVQGGPPNTCGELDIKRNGVWQYTPNWLCTDSTGYAQKGPWNWSDKASDETGEPVFIAWPDGTTTDSTYVIVDKNIPWVYVDSPGGAPPTSFYGHATDAQWGAGFDFAGTCSTYFLDTTTHLYWDPATGNYTSSGQKRVTPSRSRVDRWFISWTVSVVPSTHTHGDNYEWTTCCDDGGNLNCAVYPFTP
jgi:hypothetical protein